MARYYIAAADGEFLKLKPASHGRSVKNPHGLYGLLRISGNRFCKKIGKKSIFIFGTVLHSSCRWRIFKIATRIRIIGPLKPAWALRTPENLRKQILWKKCEKIDFHFRAHASFFYGSSMRMRVAILEIRHLQLICTLAGWIFYEKWHERSEIFWRTIAKLDGESKKLG